MPKTTRVSSTLSSSSSSSSSEENPYQIPLILSNTREFARRQRVQKAKELFATFNPATVKLSPHVVDPTRPTFKIIPLDKKGNYLVVYNNIDTGLLLQGECCARSADYTMSMCLGEAAPRYAAHLAPLNHIGTKDHPTKYNYGGKAHACVPYSKTDVVLYKALLAYAAKVTPELFENTKFTASFGVYNFYSMLLKGCGSIGKHGDNEFTKFEGYKPNDLSTHWTLILTLSLGMERILIIRGKDIEDTKITIPSGSLYAMMGPSFQLDYTHEIPKAGARETPGNRFSLTFRFFDENKK
jgi:hypothetical protein